MTTRTLQEAVDAAVLAYRELGTPEARQALMDAMTAHHNDFLRREREEALARGVEIYTAKEKT
jgi:hypothetical protein